MKLTELLALVGDENIQFQVLHDCMTNIRQRSRRKGGNEISFATNGLTPTDVMQNTGNVGLVVWIPRDKWIEATKNI